MLPNLSSAARVSLEHNKMLVEVEASVGDCRLDGS